VRILLVNPPNSGRSIPEEKYGMDTVRRIFRGEPLALEVLAGNLPGHEVRILDLKVCDSGFEESVAAFAPDVVGFTAMTCEANAALALARRVRGVCPSARTVVGGIHASKAPEYFYRPEVDYVAVGLGKASFRELVESVESGGGGAQIPGVAHRDRTGRFRLDPRAYGPADLVEGAAPRYDLVAENRSSYSMSLVGLNMGFVVSAYGCPHRCSFCCIESLTGGKYLVHAPETIVRDIGLLGGVDVVRLVDANTFGSLSQARALADAIAGAGLSRQYVADVRADTVVSHPDLFRLWRDVGLRSVVIGLEEMDNRRLAAMNKGASADVNRKAVDILGELGITIIGDFIVSPDYGESDFDALEDYVHRSGIHLPIFAILTPLPGTPLYEGARGEIVIEDLDYYTLTNAVTRTRLPEDVFYRRYAEMVRSAHRHARL